MIKDNVIYFGYGDILISSSWLSDEICFTHFKPAQEVGTMVNVDKVDVIQEINITASLKELLELREALNNAEKTKVIKFNGCILDFTKFNQISVNAVITPVNKMIGGLLVPLAC